MIGDEDGGDLISLSKVIEDIQQANVHSNQVD